VSYIVRSLSFDKGILGRPKINNIGSGKPLSVHNFCSYWWKKWDAKGELIIGAVPYKKNEVMRYVPEIDKDNE